MFRRRNCTVVETDKQTDDDKPAGQAWGGGTQMEDANRGLQPRTGFQEKVAPGRGGVVGKRMFWAQGTAQHVPRPRGRREKILLKNPKDTQCSQALESGWAGRCGREETGRQGSCWGPHRTGPRLASSGARLHCKGSGHGDAE